MRLGGLKMTYLTGNLQTTIPVPFDMEGLIKITHEPCDTSTTFIRLTCVRKKGCHHSEIAYFLR